MSRRVQRGVCLYLGRADLLLQFCEIEGDSLILYPKATLIMRLLYSGTSWLWSWSRSAGCCCCEVAPGFRSREGADYF